MINEKNKNEGYYAVIPMVILQDKKLTSTAKLIYGQISALVNKEGYCWAKNEYFSQLFNCTTKTVSRSIKQLEKRNYIRVEIKKEKGNLRKIWIKPLWTKMSIGKDTKVQRFPQKCPDLSNNKIKNKNNILLKKFKKEKEGLLRGMRMFSFQEQARIQEEAAREERRLK